MDGNWQVLTEAAQTMLRAENAGEDAYDKLKNFSRGETVDKKRFRDFVESLPLSAAAKKQLSALSPRDYCGLAAALARLPSERR